MNTQLDTSPWHVPEQVAPRFGAAVCQFLDLATTATGRATHYNSQAEQDAAERAGHRALLELDRGLYAALLMLPGVSDRAKSVGLRELLATPRQPGGSADSSLLDVERVEPAVLEQLVSELPAARLLRTLAGFSVATPELGLRRINNARARKLALRTILAAPRLELWSVKYRSKLRRILVHAWGRKTASFLREALSTPVGERSLAQQRAIARHIGKHAGASARVARECVGFVLGALLEPTLPLLVAFEHAKLDLSAGARLPLEVLEGLRSTYHPLVERASLLELSKRSLTRTQRRQLQRAAAEHGVELDMDPMDYQPVQLYIHAFAVGMSDAIARALEAKAKAAAARFPVRYDRVGVLVDASASMAGHASQALRPIAAALALRDMLTATSERALVGYCGGEFRPADHAELSCPAAFTGLCRPRGETSLADGLIELLQRSEDETGELPEVIYLISDGYENASAGRLAEVIRALRDLGIHLPIYHLSPVFAAETAGEARGIRSLSDQVPALAATRPDALGLSFLRALTQVEPARGVNALLRAAAAKLGPALALPQRGEP